MTMRGAKRARNYPYWRTHHVGLPRGITVHKPALVIVIGDTHCGSTLGLVHGDGCYRDDGEWHEPTAGQAWLWKCFTDFVKRAQKAARGRTVYGVLNGDLIDGNHHGSTQLISANVKDQRAIAIDALEPVTSLCDRLFVIRGTGAHAGQASQDDDAIGKELKAVKPREGAHSWWELRAEFGGVLFDISHHTQGGGRLWTSGGPAIRLASEALMLSACHGERVPALVIRSHVHRYHDSGDNIPGCRAITLPALQLRTEYGYRIAAKPADIGGLLVQCNAGNIEHLEVARYAPETQRPWREKA